MHVMSKDPVEQLCRQILDGHVPDETDVRRLLEAEPRSRQAVFEAAREMRSRTCGDVVFLYGFVYFSTHCRNLCSFCLYRAGNTFGPRYRKSADEVVMTCRDLARSGVVLLDLTTGEDPDIHGDPAYHSLLELIGAVHGATGLPLMISPGFLPDEVFSPMRERGARWYALYQEAHNRELYARLRPGQSYSARRAARAAARRAGLLVEDGILTGIGDSPGDRARSILEMRVSGCQQVRVMSFVPQQGTPLAHVAPPPVDNELLTIAAMRLAMPERFIPASLDVAGIDGLKPRLNAVANIVTSIVPPRSGFLGVSQSELGVDQGQRTLANVVPRLRRLGLRAGSLDEYHERLDWLSARATVFKT